MTLSRTTLVTIPLQRLRVDSEATGAAVGADARVSANLASSWPSMRRRPLPVVRLLPSRPESTHLRTVSGLTPSRAAASLTLYVDMSSILAFAAKMRHPRGICGHEQESDYPKPVVAPRRCG